jgi:hypothetical protein
MAKGSLAGAGINTVFVQRRRGVPVVVGLDEISTIWCEVQAQSVLFNHGSKRSRALLGRE